jgi:hypothetical protein
MPTAVTPSSLESIPGGFGEDFANRNKDWEAIEAAERKQKTKGTSEAAVSEPFFSEPEPVEPPKSFSETKLTTVQIKAPWFGMSLRVEDWYLDGECLVLIGNSEIALTPGISDLVIEIPGQEPLQSATLISRGSSKVRGVEIWVLSIDESV